MVVFKKIGYIAFVGIISLIISLLLVGALNAYFRNSFEIIFILLAVGWKTVILPTIIATTIYILLIAKLKFRNQKIEIVIKFVLITLCVNILFGLEILGKNLYEQIDYSEAYNNSKQWHLYYLILGIVILLTEKFISKRLTDGKEENIIDAPDS